MAIFPAFGVGIRFGIILIDYCVPSPNQKDDLDGVSFIYIPAGWNYDIDCFPPKTDRCALLSKHAPLNFVCLVAPFLCFWSLIYMSFRSSFFVYVFFLSPDM